jgi:hypothetical protein
MYELKFSEEAMERAFTLQEETAKNLKKLKKEYPNTSVNNVDLIIDNGLNQIIHTMYISRNWEGSLNVYSNDIEEDSESPITTNFYFQFRPNNLCILDTGGDHVYIKTKTINPTQLYEFLKNLYYCEELGMEVMSSEETNIFDKDKIYEDLSWFLEISNGPSMLKKIKAGLTPGYINTSTTLTDSIKEITKCCTWLMPDSKISTVKDRTCERMATNSCTQKNAIGYIEYIFEKDNYRLGILDIRSKNYWGRDNQKRIFLLGHEHELFNYADVGKISLFGNHGHYSNTIQINNLLGKVIFTEDVVLPTGEALDWIIKRIHGENTTLLDANQLKLSVKKFFENLKRENEEAEEKKLLEAKLQTKIKSLEKGSKILLNGMTIEKTKLEYEGQILSLENSNNWVAGLLSDLSRMYKFDDINWDSVFDMFIIVASTKTSKGRIGDVNFNLIFENTTNRANVTSTKTYINGKRINKDEIRDCLRRAVCYLTQEDYDEFLTNVSQCSLKFHRYLQIGLDFSVRGISSREGFSFKLPIERKKNLMYIVLEDSENRKSFET